MRTLHIAPGDSAGGSLAKALRDAGRDEEVLRSIDDLSCGPIDSDDPSARTRWWSQFHSDAEEKDLLAKFWNRVATADERLVVWFGRHSAQELAFFLALADRLGDRPYDIVDVTNLPGLPRRVALLQGDRLSAQLGSARPVTAQEREEARAQWQRLRRESAPFRVVSPAGLVSAPIDYFDPWLMARATPDWQRSISLVMETIGHNAEPYYQVGDVMLLTRIVALVEAGKLLADGDPWDMRSCRLRLPG
jgi:hypothetical protein